MLPVLESAAGPSTRRIELAATLLEHAIQAERSGTLAELVRQRPRAAQWLVRRWLPVLRGAAGDALADDDLPRAAAWLLRWAVTQLRPDAAPRLDGLDDEIWLQRHGWRPFVAMAGHLGHLVIPDFPRHYRRRPGESALDNLCGLWGVQPSTLYRVLERARQTMAALAVDSAPDAARCLALRQWAAGQALPACRPPMRPRGPNGTCVRRSALRRGATPRPSCGTAHRRSDLDGFTRALVGHAAALAAAPRPTRWSSASRPAR